MTTAPIGGDLRLTLPLNYAWLELHHAALSAEVGGARWQVEDPELELVK